MIKIRSGSFYQPTHNHSKFYVASSRKCSQRTKDAFSIPSSMAIAFAAIIGANDRVPPTNLEVEIRVIRGIWIFPPLCTLAHSHLQYIPLGC